jgi:Fe-S cluster biogenesis protein NfuA
MRIFLNLAMRPTAYVSASGACIACPTSSESIIAQCEALLWALINVLDIVLDLEDAVARIGVGA